MADKLQLVDDWPEPTPGPEEVLIDIKAAGLNFPDVLIIQGKYQFQPEMPFIPGGECAGVVKAVGENVSRYKPGDKVIGMMGHGCFADAVAMHQAAVSPMPEGLDFRQAAGVAVTYFTSYHALKQRARLQAGETLRVHMDYFHFDGNLEMEIYEPGGSTLVDFSYNSGPDFEDVEVVGTVDGVYCVRVFGLSSLTQNNYSIEATID